MPSPTLAAGPSTALPPLAPAIRTGVTLLAVAAFALSYDALRQMAAASHIHPALTYAFPLVIDGFIAIGIGALLVLRTAPLSARLYVSALVGIATATSIWANVLHAIRLNQQNRRSALALDDLTVGPSPPSPRSPWPEPSTSTCSSNGALRERCPAPRRTKTEPPLPKTG